MNHESTIDEWRKQSIKRLKQVASEPVGTNSSPELDIDCLLMHQLQCDRSYVFTWGDRRLSGSDRVLLDQYLERRLSGEPIAYITGQREFWSFSLETDPNTLIPRPDTETLVEAILDLPVEHRENRLRCLDLGTGTGAIALAVASERKHWLVTGIDFKDEAVQVATRNATRLDLAVEFYRSDWFSEVKGQFDIIVSNPPYIDHTDKHLSEGDVRFEPKSALVANEQGLADIRHLIEQSPHFLVAGGWLLFEHGYQQAEEVTSLFKRNGYQRINSIRDLAGQPRVTFAQWRL